MPPAVTRIQSNRATFYFNITSWIRCNYVTLSSQYEPKSDLQKIRVVLKAKLGLGVPNKKVDRIAFFYSALCLKKKQKKKQVQQSHYSFATDNFNILSKEVELHITSHRSFPRRCRQSSLLSGHTSRRDGCSGRSCTETLTQHISVTPAGGFELNHTTPRSHHVHLCNQSACRRPCFWAGRHQTAHRKRNQQCSSCRKPRRSHRHSHPHHCIRNPLICTFCSGRQIHLWCTTHGL